MVHHHTEPRAPSRASRISEEGEAAETVSSPNLFAVVLPLPLNHFAPLMLPAYLNFLSWRIHFIQINHLVFRMRHHTLCILYPFKSFCFNR
jgi:hypothetical protein